MVSDGRQHYVARRLAGLTQGLPLEETLAFGLQLGAREALNIRASIVPGMARAGVPGTVALAHQGATVGRQAGAQGRRGHGRIVRPWCDLGCHTYDFPWTVP